MPTFNPEKRYTTVGGRPGIAFLQDGHAFDAGHKCVGKCNEQGELEPKKAPATPPQPPQGGEGQQAAGDKPLTELKVDELKAIASEAGIEGAASMNKAALIEAITERQAQSTDGQNEGGA